MMAEWQPRETAPKDGTPVLWAGKWRVSEQIAGGGWEMEIFQYGSLHGNMKREPGWFNSSFRGPGNWNVDWLYWTHLPEPPE